MDETNSGSKWALNTLAISALLAAIVLMRTFLMPVILAFLLALTLSPIRRSLNRAGIPSGVAAAGLVLLLFSGVFLLFTILSEPIADYAANSRTIAYDVERKLRGLSETIDTVTEAGQQVEQITNGSSEEGAAEVVVAEPSLVSRLAASAPFVVGQGIFTLVLLFFITASGDLFYQKIVEVSPTFRDKRNAIELTRDVERRISRYFLTITVINMGLGVAVGIALWISGMPNPLLFGVMAFLLNFIPYIGSLIGIALTGTIAVISLDTLSLALVPMAAYFVLTTIEGQFVTPLAVGRQLSLNPVIVFIVVAFWGWAWSVIGMFVAVPLLIVAVVIFERSEKLSGIAVFLTGKRASQSDQKSSTD